MPYRPEAPTSLALQELRPSLPHAVWRAFSLLYEQASVLLSSQLSALRFSSLQSCGQPSSRSCAPASSLRPYEPWSASSQPSYEQAFSLQSSALKRLPLEMGGTTRASQKRREICGGCINEAIPTPKPKIRCQSKKRETQYFITF